MKCPKHPGHSVSPHPDGAPELYCFDCREYFVIHPDAAPQPVAETLREDVAKWLWEESTTGTNFDWKILTEETRFLFRSKAERLLARFPLSAGVIPRVEVPVDAAESLRSLDREYEAAPESEAGKEAPAGSGEAKTVPPTNETDAEKLERISRECFDRECALRTENGKLREQVRQFKNERPFIDGETATLKEAILNMSDELEQVKRENLELRNKLAKPNAGQDTP